MSDLITLSEYKSYDTTASSSDDALLQTLVTGASSYIERYCNRTFLQTTYDQLYDGTGYRTLLLDAYPIISISRVATSPANVLTIRNDTASVSRATVAVTSTGITLASVSSAVTTTTTLAFATYTTLATLASAINAVSGWTATVASDYTTWASADLRAIQGVLSAKNNDAYLVLHTSEVSGVLTVNEALGEIENRTRFVKGVKNWRVVYSAGFTQVPSDIKAACMEIVKAMYMNRRLNPNLTAESLGVWSYTRSINQLALSEITQQTLSLYRNYRVPRYRLEGIYWR